MDGSVPCVPYRSESVAGLSGECNKTARFVAVLRSRTAPRTMDFPHSREIDSEIGVLPLLFFAKLEIFPSRSFGGLKAIL